VERTEAPGTLAASDVTLAAICLNDVGAHDAQGVVMSELTNLIAKAVFEAIVSHGANLPSALAGELRSGLGRPVGGG
jgi:hypothetical protein